MDQVEIFTFITDQANIFFQTGQIYFFYWSGLEISAHAYLLTDNLSLCEKILKILAQKN